MCPVVHVHSADHRTSEKVKKISVIKTGCEQKISKKLQLLEQKIAFSKRKYSSMYNPPIEYKPPKKNFAKRPFDQK